MSGKVGALLSNPEWAWRHITTETKTVQHMISDGRFKEAAIYCPTLVGESDPYDKYLQSKADEDRRIVKTIEGNEMVLNLDDEGLSRELLTVGQHEPNAAKYFQNELAELRQVVSPVTILEVGGNIGYYTLLEANILDNKDEIYVCEPGPRNVEILEENIRRNGYDEMTEISQVGLSNSTGTAEFYLSSKSNCHSFEEDSRHRDTNESIEVDVKTVDQFIQDAELSPDSINVVRMDVEGHEAKIIEGMQSVLDGSGPLLLYIELHSELIDNNELDDVLAKLTDGGLEFVVGFNDHPARGIVNICNSIENLSEDIRYGPYENIQAFFKRVY